MITYEMPVARPLNGTKSSRLPVTMKAAVFVEPGKIELQERPLPAIGPTDALLRVTTTTICGTGFCGWWVRGECRLPRKQSTTRGIA